MKKQERPYVHRRFIALALMGAMISTPLAVFGQAGVRAVFVSNNGNLEGSVSSFTINPDSTLQIVNKVVTGTRVNLNDPCAGCNAYEISLTPNGRFIALAHPAGVLDGITILQVGADASLTQVFQLPMTVDQDGPMDLQWLDNQNLAVLRTAPVPNQVAIYHFTLRPLALALTNVYPAGSFSAYLTLHPSGQYLYVSNSSSPAYQVYAFAVGTGGVLTPIDTQPTGANWPLELAISRDGKMLYSAAGISGSGHDVIGMSVAPDGTLGLMSGSPFASPGSSPSHLYVSDDNRYCIVGHGQDGTMHVLAIDQVTGALTDTGFGFDVGSQGSIGGIRAMRDLLFVTNNFDAPTGVYSFTIGEGGALTQNGAVASTTGIAPRSIAAWTPPIGGDMDCDGDLDLADISAFVLALVDPPGWAMAYPYCNMNRGDMNGDGLVDAADIQLFVDAIIP